MSKYNSQNNKNFINKTKFNWELHQKLQKNYIEYLTYNQVNIKLKGNSNFNNRPISYYLENNKEPITNEIMNKLDFDFINIVQMHRKEKKYEDKKKNLNEYIKNFEEKNKVKKLKKNIVLQIY